MPQSAPASQRNSVCEVVLTLISSYLIILSGPLQSFALPTCPRQSSIDLSVMSFTELSRTCNHYFPFLEQITTIMPLATHNLSCSSSKQRMQIFRASVRLGIPRDISSLHHVTATCRVDGTEHHKTALAGTKCNTCSLLHCLVHVATNQLCIVACTNTYPSAQTCDLQTQNIKVTLT
jgi:hypothetical protein